jgi:GAF domain-containing protein
VPILKSDELLGVIIVHPQEGIRPFTDKQMAQRLQQSNILDRDRCLVSKCLDKRQRTDDLGRSVGELRALGEVSQAVNSTLDLETVLSTIVAKAVQLSGRR